ncbi:MAG: [FeFe] hydrogenase H-cluster radical SAM maturase HydG [Elusimicrobia bacterium]|nr:[FeFe] hydrogenase H-cluster radical SAM maturase HydG [Elusimicrobiota bacterium]
MSQIPAKKVLPPHTRYDSDFADEKLIRAMLAAPKADNGLVHDIIAKTKENREALEPAEAAALLSVDDPELLEEMFAAAAAVKKAVYDNRVVTFAPLYCSNYCVNNCVYCGFRSGNGQSVRRALTQDEVRRETEVLCGQIGHKRLVSVYGEHPDYGADYIAQTMSTIYSVKVPVRSGIGQIRRVNVNAAPMTVDELKTVKAAGIGTFQVFQETYDRDLYARLHPGGTPKSDFRWRLYALHRAFEAGIDDVAIGALFGLGDWKFEVLGLLLHARDLEKTFGVGPHTVSFPRLENACGSALKNKHQVSDADFKKLVAVLRLCIPYAGMIVTARETPEVIRSVIAMCTQRDASTRIGIGAYSDRYTEQESERQQFLLGDTRPLDAVIAELAEMGHITSFCTSGYRCGRTGDHIMKMLKSGHEGRFCKLNAVLTFREWLNDFASDSTKAAGEKLIARELAEIRAALGTAYTPEIFNQLLQYQERINKGERDLCF